MLLYNKISDTALYIGIPPTEYSRVALLLGGMRVLSGMFEPGITSFTTI